jgi:hypothetical protein
LPVLKGETYEKPISKATVRPSSKVSFSIRKGDWIDTKVYGVLHKQE